MIQNSIDISEKTIVSEAVINSLKNLLKDKESYIKHLKVLWVLRELVYDKLYPNCPKDDPNFLMFNTLNQIISVFITNRECFDEFRNETDT